MIPENVHDDLGAEGMESRRTPDYTLASTHMPRDRAKRWTWFAASLALVMALTLLVSDVSEGWKGPSQGRTSGLWQNHETELIPWGPGHASRAVQIRRSYSNSQIERILKAEDDATAAALTLLKSVRKQRKSIKNPALEKEQVQARDDMRSMDRVLDAMNNTHDEDKHPELNASSPERAESSQSITVEGTEDKAGEGKPDAANRTVESPDQTASTDAANSTNSTGNATAAAEREGNRTSTNTSKTEGVAFKREKTEQHELKDPPFHAATAPELKCFPMNEDGQIYEVTRSAVFCWYYPVWCQLNCRASNKAEGLNLLRSRPRDYNSEG
mmetsp:Transcript_34715/g.54224  ORF Transcript_34715/g.54224 Transcript_34715/m.54224 type:complete len:328 (+) Transcript_34715:154-1137(+)